MSIKKGLTKVVGGKETDPMINALTWVIIVLTVVVGFTVYKSLKAGAGSAAKALGNQAVSVQTGVPAERVALLRSLAETMWKDGVTNYWLTYNFNEDLFIRSLNACVNATEEVIQTGWYNEESGRSIRSDVNSSFSEGEKRRLKGFILSSLT